MYGLWGLIKWFTVENTDFCMGISNVTCGGGVALAPPLAKNDRYRSLEIKNYINQALSQRTNRNKCLDII